jgi:predicted nucleic acid-binding protein
VSIVVDSSTVVAALLSTDLHGEWAERLVAEHALYAPELVLVEVTSVLRRLEFSKEITTAEASAARDDLMQLELELFGFEPFAERIWELRQSVTSYDAWYVAIAEALEFPLATLDNRLARSSAPKCEFLLANTRKPGGR